MFIRKLIIILAMRSLTFSGCGPDLQVYVVGQGQEGLGPVRRSKVEGAHRLQRYQNPEDGDRMHLQTSQKYSGKQTISSNHPFPHTTAIKKLQTALTVRQRYHLHLHSSSFQILDLQTIFSEILRTYLLEQ